MAIAGTLEIQMLANMARLADDMGKAKSLVGGAMNSIEAAVASAKSALGALGIGLSAGAFVSFVEGGIKAEAKLYDLALQTGITVEILSALKGVAKLAGTDLDTVAGMVNKLQKNMLQFGTDGGGKAAQAFAQLGYTSAQVKAGLKDMDAFLPEFARRLVQTGVGGEQAGLAMQLMAKGGAAALPFLKELAENGPLVAKVFTEQAEAAKRFEDNVIKLKAGSGALAISLANDFLPALNEITAAMIKAKTEGGSLAAIWAGLKAVTVGTEKFQAEKDLFDQVSKQLALEASLARLRRDGYKDETFAVITTKEKLAKVKDDIAQSRARIELLQREQDIRDKANKLGERKDLRDLPDTAAADAAAKEAQRLQDANLKGYLAYYQSVVDADFEATKAVADNQIAELDAYLAREKKLEEESIKGWVAMAEAKVQADFDAAKQLAEVQIEATKNAEKLNTIGRDLGLTFSSAFEDSLVKGKSFRDVLKGIEMDIARIIARKAITEPLADSVSSAFKGTGGFSGIFGNLFGTSAGSGAASWTSGSDLALGSYASGTDYVPETGLYQLHKGEAVTPSADNNSGGSAPVIVNIYQNNLDSRSGVQFLAQNKDAIGAIINQAFTRGGRRSGMTL